MTGSRLGRFTVPHETSSGIVYIRGLTVAEYIDLARQGFFSRREFETIDFVEIAHACVVSSDIEGPDGTILESMDDIQYVIQHTEVVEIGQRCASELTLVDEEMESKARGYIRFAEYVSHDGRSSISKSYDCSFCIQNNHWRGRKELCGRYTEEQVEDLRAQYGLQSEDKSVASPKGRGRYRSNRKGSSGLRQKESKSVIRIANFKFPQCPTSWIPDWLWLAGNVFHHADSANVPLLSGGLMDQPYQIYRIGRIIAGEFATIKDEQKT